MTPHVTARASDNFTRLDQKEAQIGILGLGYVGLPLMRRFTEVGYRVLGFDIDPLKVDKLNAGETYIEHIPAASLQGALDAGFQATTNFSRAGQALYGQVIDQVVSLSSTRAAEMTKPK